MDPRGFTASLAETETKSSGQSTTTKDADYLYSASGKVLARTRASGETKLFFYFGVRTSTSSGPTAIL